MRDKVGGNVSSTSGMTIDDRSRTGEEAGRNSGEGSPLMMSPWNQTSAFAPASNFGDTVPPNALVGSLVREEGHIYSLAATGDLLYTGSDSKNIRVWKN